MSASRFASFIACVLIGLSIGVAQDAEPVDGSSNANSKREPVSRELVSGLIEQLDSRKLSTRDDAERDLLKLGPDILPLLPAPELLTSIQVKQAVRRLRIKLEHQLANESIQASRLSSSGTFPLREIADLIRTQTGNELVVAKSLGEKPFDIDWAKQPFWTAIDSLEKQGLATTFNAQTGQFELVAGDSGHVGVWQHDAFRATLSPLTFKPNGDEQLIGCELKLACEPRLRPLLLRYEAADWNLTSSSGNAISNFNPSAKYEIPLGQAGREAKLQLNFLSTNLAPARSPAKLDPADGKAATFNLKGRATMLTAAREQPIEFARLAVAGVVRRRAGVSVNLQSVDEHVKDGVRHLRVQAQVSYDIGKNAFESHQTWIFHNRVYLETASGEQIALNDGFETLFQADGSVGVVYCFKDVKQALNDLRFVYVAPTLLINVPLDFEFSNIGIPKAKL